MADETSMTPAVESASADTSPKPKEKKTRAPRKPKAAPDAVAETAVTAPVKRTRGPGKKTLASPAAGATVPAAKVASPAKKPAVTKAQPAKRASAKVAVQPVDTDGFADLLQLEQENQKLRKALSEKLRSENADLRKKLGLA